MSKKPHAYKRGRLNVSSKGKLPHAKKPTLRRGSEIGWTRSSLQKRSCFLRNTDQDWSAPEPSWQKTRLCYRFVQLLSHFQLFVTPWTAAHQISLSFTISWSLFQLLSIELVMPRNHLIFCYPLLLLPSSFPSIRVFSNWVSSSHQVANVLELQLQRQSFQWTPRTDLLEDWLVWSPCRPGDSRVFSNTVQKHQFFSAQLSL